jgi:hypothetical protein
MRLLLRRTALSLAAGSLIVLCSCERHHVGELAPAQDGHQNDEAHAHAAGTAPTIPSHVSPSPSVAATPANFFPTATPH